MKITQEQFNKAQKTFSEKSLSDTQKHTMLSNIYLENKKAINKPVMSPLSSYFAFFRQKAVVAVAVVVLLVSGTSYASAHSLPGDLLYGMKVSVIEQVGLAFRFSEESKNEYKMSLLQKRVEELETLKQRDKLDEDSKKASSDATDKNIKELEISAIFDERGENINVSEKVKAYNSLIGKELEIKTTIEIDYEGDSGKQEEATIEEIVDDLGVGLGELEDSGTDVEENTEVEEEVEIENQDELPLDIKDSTDGNVPISGL